MASKYHLVLVLLFGPTAWARYETKKFNLYSQYEMSMRFMAKEICDQNHGGPHAYEMAMKATVEFSLCCEALELDDINTLPTKSYNRTDEQIKKLCPKRETAINCLDNLIKGVNSCFNGKQMEDIKTARNIIKQATEFICYNNVEHYTLFIDEGGPQCIQENNRDISECMFKVMTAKSNDALAGAFNRKQLPSFFGDKECELYEELKECIVGPMKSCKSSYPADFVKSFYKAAFNDTPCDNTLSTGIIVLIAVAVIVIVILLILVACKLCC